MIFITMPAVRQYTKQITLHENETIHYIYTIYTLYENVIWSLLPGYMIRYDRHKSALSKHEMLKQNCFIVGPARTMNQH